MHETKIFDSKRTPSPAEKNDIIDFLFEHLDAFGDPKAAIEKAYDFALRESDSLGGLVLVHYRDAKIAGAVVLNRTGMKDYIPENILVYIATRREWRGQGIGKQLMTQTVAMADGNVALHVEPDNPARFLYEKVGFTTKYIEMRLIK